MDPEFVLSMSNSWTFFITVNQFDRLFLILTMKCFSAESKKVTEETSVPVMMDKAEKHINLCEMIELKLQHFYMLF